MLDAVVDHLHQHIPLRLLRQKIRYAVLFQGMAVDAALQRPPGGQHAGGFAGEALPAGVGRRLQHTQKGHRRQGLEPGEKIVGSVAGHDEAVRSARRQLPDGIRHLGHRIGPAP